MIAGLIVLVVGLIYGSIAYAKGRHKARLQKERIRQWLIYHHEKEMNKIMRQFIEAGISDKKKSSKKLPKTKSKSKTTSKKKKSG
jgi:hypothetical protein